MKKLMMVAAAMTIAGGAFAQCGYDPQQPGPQPGSCALVYSMKLSAKTTVAKYLQGQIVSGSGTVCGYGQAASTNAPVIYRTPAKIGLQGYWLNCSCDCTELANEESAFDQSWLWLWENRSRNYWFNDGEYGVDDPPEVAYDWDASQANPLVANASPTQRGLIEWGPAFNIDGYGIVRDSFIGPNIRNPFNLIGPRNTQVEAFWNIDRVFALPQFMNDVLTVPPRAIAIYAAGFGRFDSRNGIMRNIAGNFAGLIDAPYYVGRDVCAPALAFDCCSCDAEYNQSVIFGDWAMKYNAALSQLAVVDAGSVYTRYCPQTTYNQAYRSNDYRWEFDITP
jgi:hypothetical protein